MEGSDVYLNSSVCRFPSEVISYADKADVVVGGSGIGNGLCDVFCVRVGFGFLCLFLMLLPQILTDYIGASIFSFTKGSFTSKTDDTRK